MVEVLGIAGFGLAWAGGAVLLGLYVALAPRAASTVAAPTVPLSSAIKVPEDARISGVSSLSASLPANVAAIISERCASCHMAQPTYPGFAAAPKNILLDTPERIVAQAQTIYQQTVVLRAMPIANLTKITDDERAILARWAEGLAGKK